MKLTKNPKSGFNDDYEKESRYQQNILIIGSIVSIFFVLGILIGMLNMESNRMEAEDRSSVEIVHNQLKYN